MAKSEKNEENVKKKKGGCGKSTNTHKPKTMIICLHIFIGVFVFNVTSLL